MIPDAPYAEIERVNPLRTTACTKCPSCRRDLDPNKRQVYHPHIGLAWHWVCWVERDRNEGAV